MFSNIVMFVTRDVLRFVVPESRLVIHRFLVPTSPQQLLPYFFPFTLHSLCLHPSPIHVALE